MTTGWAELLQQALKQHEAGSLDPDALWAQFEFMAGRSGRVELEVLLDTGRHLVAEDRAALAASVAGMLSRVEWPIEWEALRPDVVHALDELLREIPSNKPDSLPRLLGAKMSVSDRELFAGAHLMLQYARDLLQGPCRRDQIAIAARICSIGHISCRRVFGRALKAYEEGKGGALPSSIVDARRRYVEAFERYAVAAGRLNDAMGSAVFEGLDKLL